MCMRFRDKESESVNTVDDHAHICVCVWVGTEQEVGLSC